MRLYVASSWRNTHQQFVVAFLRQNGHEVYDFRNPGPGDRGFRWSEIDPNWQDWTCEEYCKALEQDLAVEGFAKDFAAMRWAEGCVLVDPCGRSAHMEAGWFVGAGKPVFVLLAEKIEPELLYRMAVAVVDDHRDLVGAIEAFLVKPNLPPGLRDLCGSVAKEQR